MTVSPTADLGKIGTFQIESVIGRGAMGMVYRARDGRDGRMVALKTIRTDLFSDEERPGAIARLRREAEIGIRLDHPAIVKVFDFLALGDTAVLAMELVDGEDLARFTGGRGMEWPAAIAVVRRLLEALAYVHAHAIVHRDVKPSNIISLKADADHAIKLMDFGVAHVSSSAMTQAGDIVGTPAYMSPEQLQGFGVDARSDVFAAGATLYALLAGRPPFSGSLASVMHQLLYVRPEPLSAVRAEVPRPIDLMVARAMEKEPDARYASAGEFLAALDEATRLARSGPTSVTVSDDATLVSTRDKRSGDVSSLAEGLSELLNTALRTRTTEKLLDAMRQLSAQIVAIPLAAEQRARIVHLCLQSGLVPLADVAIASAPIPGVRLPSTRPDFMALLTLMDICRRLIGHLDPKVEANVPIKRVAMQLQQAASGFATSLSQMLSGEDSPDIAGISANFMRLDVLELGLEVLGAEEERRSLAATEAILVNQVMTKVNATIRAYTQTGDMLARFGVASLLAEIEELIVFAERLVERPTGIADAFEAVGRQTLAEFIRHAGTLAQMTVDELSSEAAAMMPDTRAFAGRIKQVGFIYLFATRVNDDGCRPLLRELSEHVHGLMKRMASETISRLKAALTTGETARIQAAAAQLTALHDLLQQLGWHELGRQLLAELRNRIVSEPSLRALFAR